MTHEEQQALFDTILRRANLPGSFNVENGIRLTNRIPTLISVEFF